MKYSVIQRESYLAKGVIAAGAALMLAVGMAVNTFAATNVVSPSDMMGWVDSSVNGGTATYADDAPSGFGSASLELKTDATNPAKAVYTHEVNQPLGEVTNLGYYSKQVAATSAGGAASMFVSVDLNNDGVWDTNLVYEPYWQNEGSPDAAPVVAGEWQQWDVDSGLFWSSRNYSGALNLTAGAGGPPFYTLDQIRTAYPDAQAMAFGVNVGSYNPEYTIRVDGVMLNDTVYDFEKVSPEPELTVPTNKDECKQNGWLGVVRADGSAFANQGQCVAYVQSSANSKHHR